jgi:hypothetical protein
MSIAKFFALVEAAEAHNLSCPSCRISSTADLDEFAVYTDGVHMTSWTVDNLHLLAARMGLKRSWFQEEGVRFRERGAVVSGDHYDLTTVGAYHRARAAGAIYLPRREFSRGFPLYRRRKALSFQDLPRASAE